MVTSFQFSDGKDHRITDYPFSNFKFQISNKPAGFTIIELVVTMMILVVFVFTVYTIFTQGTLAWQKSISHTTAYASAREVLSDISESLSKVHLSTIAAAAGIYFIYVNNTPSSPLATTFTNSCQAEMVFTMCQDLDPSLGSTQDIFEIGYYLDNNSTPGNPIDDSIMKLIKADPDSAARTVQPLANYITDFTISVWGPATTSWIATGGAADPLNAWTSLSGPNINTTPAAALITVRTISPGKMRELLAQGAVYDSRPSTDPADAEDPAFTREKVTLSTIVRLR